MNGIFVNPFVEGIVCMALGIAAYALQHYGVPVSVAEALIVFGSGYLTPHVTAALRQ